MKLFALAGGILLCCLLTAIAGAEKADDQSKAKTIPLDQIWAYKMHGTKEIERSAKEADMRLLGSIFKSWLLRAEKLKFKDVARPGFAVQGSGLSALRAAHSIFVDGTKPIEKFSPDDEITIVFFSEPSSGNYVRIKQVEREGNQIEIQYQLEPYLERTLSESFALIPLGKIPAGEYRVEMHQLAREKKFNKWGLKPLDEDWSRQVLCKPFRFAVAVKRE